MFFEAILGTEVILAFRGRFQLLICQVLISILHIQTLDALIPAVTLVSPIDLHPDGNCHPDIFINPSAQMTSRSVKIMSRGGFVTEPSFEMDSNMLSTSGMLRPFNMDPVPYLCFGQEVFEFVDCVLRGK